jgi:hypothetical protein
MTALQNNKKRLSTAKQHFLQAVREGMDVLMKEGGYGRERATQTLLHELGKTTEPPTDNEVRLSVCKYSTWIDVTVRIDVLHCNF